VAVIETLPWKKAQFCQRDIIPANSWHSSAPTTIMAKPHVSIW